MFANIDDWQSDRGLESEGVPLDLGKGRSITLRRAGGSNKAFMVAVAEVIRRVIGERNPEDVPDAEIDEDLKSVYADRIVVGWHGFKDADGDDIPYSRENFLELMNLAPDMWLRVRASANTREMFQGQKDRKAMQRDKDVIKKSSRGKRNGAASAHV
jgi:hypothetical protein